MPESCATVPAGAEGSNAAAGWKKNSFLYGPSIDCTPKANAYPRRCWIVPVPFNDVTSLLYVPQPCEKFASACGVGSSVSMSMTPPTAEYGVRPATPEP